MSDLSPEQFQQGPGSRRPVRPGPWVAFPSSSRVQRARYDGNAQQVHVQWKKEGVGYTYDEVPRNVWNNMRRSKSPGKFVNRVLNGYPYWKGGFNEASGQDIDEQFQP